MSEDTDMSPAQEPSKLDILKARAEKLGIKYHHRVGEEKLAAQIKKVLEQPDELPVITAPVNSDIQKAETARQHKGRMRKDAARLVRIRVTCMNPNKKDWEGEMYTVSNSVAGTFKKYVPFNAENGWHVPNIIYKHMLERKCQIFYTVKGPQGNKIRKGKLVPELNIEVLEPLTRTEIKDLATQQAMAGNIGT